MMLNNMKRLEVRFLVLCIGMSALALTGCSSSSSRAPESGVVETPTQPPVETPDNNDSDSGADDPLIAASGTARGVSFIGADSDDGDVIISGVGLATTDYSYDSTRERVTLTFTSGNLAGRTIVFDTDTTGEAVSGLNVGEEGFLTTISNANSIAAFVEVSISNSSAIFSALHTGTATTDLPTSGVLNYSGTLIGVAANATLGGDAMGSVAISADFDTNTVLGTVSGIGLIDDDTGAVGSIPTVGFTASMDSSSATYSGTTLTIGGSSATGMVEGGFYGPGAIETAGGLTAQSDSDVIIGAFGATLD